MLAKKYNVSDEIYWHGWQQNPWYCANEADALVLASEYEGFSLVTIEAWAAGIPVISTPVGIIPELLKPGENGFLFPFGDTKSLANILKAIALHTMPDIDPETCKYTVKIFQKEQALADFELKLWKIFVHFIPSSHPTNPEPEHRYQIGLVMIVKNEGRCLF